MNKHKHTSGPWKPYNRGDVYGHGDVFEIHWSDDGECIAEIVHGEADANLISAAPELLEALEEVLDVFGPRFFEGNVYRKKSLKMAQYAIKKALGETR